LQTYALAIVTPVHNDWPSFRTLLGDIDASLAKLCKSITIIAVNDGSSLERPPQLLQSGSPHLTVKVVNLAVNLGHQRAIAVGLTEALKLEVDSVVVIDADGEDRPSDIARMIAFHGEHPDTIIVAKRDKRSEGLFFLLFYSLYKLLFALCTGSQISHGNFCLIPAGHINGLLHSSFTWNNLAASILRSRIPFERMLADRGQRYEGQSKMTFISLMLHGLSAVAVYFDVFAARLLTACLAVLGFIALLSVGILSIRLFTDLAIPGWTSVVLGIFGIVMLQLLVLCASTLFSYLNNRGQLPVIPAQLGPSYIQSIVMLTPATTGQPPTPQTRE
jgi:glycosyltransferase involved in cell wall biosynthesis